jgi:hypothetical protein
MHVEKNEFDSTWEVLLSREPDRILAVFASLSPPEQEAVIAHLEKMVSEPGWQPGQRLSAQAALDAILKNVA